MNLARSSVVEICLPVGSMSIRLLVPGGVQGDNQRILYWWEVTSAAVALSQHLQEMGDLSGNRAVELGCGLGLAGLTAALLGANVTFTDYASEAIASVRENARANCLDETGVRFAVLDWERPAEIGMFSLVVGSEILYDYFTHGDLINLLDRLLEDGGTILLADRPRLAVSRFIGRLIQRGFRCSQTRRRMELGSFPSQDVSIFALRRHRD